MKRRSFLKKLPLAVSVPFTLAGIPMQVMGENILTKLIRSADNVNDKVLIILQLHGGNDGMNTLIPVEQYDLYYSRRPNIAIPAKSSLRKYIPLDSTLPSENQVGLHPDMQAIKGMYDTGRAAFVQGVSYENNNGSHFRGRDIQFMGGGADDYLQSGWVGRYLNQVYSPYTYPADFPLETPNPENLEMLDPLGIEMGNDTSLIFHQQGNIPTSISLPSNLEAFSNLVNELPGFEEGVADPRGIPPDVVENSAYWKEMNWILGLEQKTDDYAQRLFEVWTAGGESSVSYPETYPFNAPSGSKRNPLSDQFQLVARLLGGGCKTKVFMVRIGGFDTHADQTTSYDPTMGGHAALLYHISATMKAFQDDLKSRGLEDRVLTVTTSEFGRRINSNASYGTDHGTGGPIMIFGKGVKAGVSGRAPDLTNSEVNNVEMQFDYREVYANLLHNWMGASETDVNNIFYGDYLNGNLEPLATTVITGKDNEFVEKRYKLEQNYPNPAKDATTIGFRINDTLQVIIDLMDSRGSKIRNLVNTVFEPGYHSIPVSLSGLQPGMYLYQMKAGAFKDIKKLMVTK
jgi:uncharacterized protein (DUF1501 family)